MNYHVCFSLLQAEFDCSDSDCTDGGFKEVSAKTSSSFINVTILEKCHTVGVSGLREIRAMSVPRNCKYLCICIHLLFDGY